MIKRLVLALPLFLTVAVAASARATGTSRMEPGDVFLQDDGPVSRNAGAVWHFNADSCRLRAIAANAAVENADLNVEAAKETKKAAVAKYFPSVTANVSAFMMHDYMLDVSSSDLSDGSLSMEVYTEGQDLESYINENLDQIAPFFEQFGIDIKQEVNDFVSGLSYNASLQMVKKGVSASVVAVQPLYSGGRIINGNKLARVGIEAAQVQRSMAVKEVGYGAEQRYWLLVSLNEKMKTLDAMSALVDTLYKDVEAAYEAGLVGMNDLLKVELKRNELLSSKTTLQNAIVLANMSLCQYVGLPLEDRIVPEDALDEMSALPGMPVIPDSADVSMRDEYRLLDLKVEAEKYKKRLILGESLPQLGIGAGYFYGNLWGRNMNNAGVFVTLSIPVSSWWDNTFNYRKQRIMERIAVNERRDYRDLLSLQVRQAWDEICSLNRQIGIYRQTIEQARENLKVNSDYYGSGMVPLSDLLEAQAIYQQSVGQYVDKCVDYKLKVLEYNQMID